MAKTFKGNTASELFINKPAQPQPVKEEKQAEGLVIPEGYVLKQETKSAKMQILLTPHIKKRLKEKSEATGISMNEIISLALDEYLKK